MRGEAREVPVIRAETSAGDRLVILRDSENPLVLELRETGADLLRRIDGIRRLDTVV